MDWCPSPRAGLAAFKEALQTHIKPQRGLTGSEATCSSREYISNTPANDARARVDMRLHRLVESLPYHELKSTTLTSQVH
jgi:hypothetical protein